MRIQLGLGLFGEAGHDWGERMKIVYRPIGVVHSPFTEPEGVPIQPAAGAGIRATVEVFEEYREGLKDLKGFSHVVLVCHLHKSRGYRLTVVPFLDDRPRGLFATRAPRRPNPIGLSVVRLRKVQKGVLFIEDVDLLEGTPVLDIKPFVPEFSEPTEVRRGWLEKVRRSAAGRRSDGRFKE